MGDAVKPALHGRDHCPGGTDPVPCIGAQSFRALRYEDDLTGIGGSDTLLDFDHWESSDIAQAIFEPLDTTETTGPVSGTDLMRFIRLKKAGLYIFQLGVHFTSTVDGFKFALNDQDPIWGRSDDIFGGPTTTYNSTGYCVGTWHRFYPLVDPFDSGTWAHDIHFGLGVIAGSSRTVDEAYLDISYHAAHFAPAAP